MSKELFNDGAITLNLDKAVHQSNDKTLLIIGQARAGTTLVASMLHETGIPIGKNFGPVHEDNDLGKFVGDLRDSRLPKAFLMRSKIGTKHIHDGVGRGPICTLW